MSPIEPVITTPPDAIGVEITTRRGVVQVIARRPSVEITDDAVIVDHVGVQITASTALEPTLDLVPTNPPSDLAATADDSNILVTWTDSIDVDLQAVQIYRSLTSGGSFSLVHTAAPGVESWLDTDVSTGVTYYYRANAVDSLGIPSLMTSEVSATVAVPDELLYLLASTDEYLAATAGGDPLIWRE